MLVMKENFLASSFCFSLHLSLFNNEVKATSLQLWNLTTPCLHKRDTFYRLKIMLYTGLWNPDEDKSIIFEIVIWVQKQVF